MRRLDWTKPYQSVVGVTQRGIRYIQDGIDYNGAGDEVKPDPAVQHLYIEQSEGAAKPPTPDYATWHHAKLRKEIISRGSAYQDKDQAIAWLTADDDSV